MKAERKLAANTFTIYNGDMVHDGDDDDDDGDDGDDDDDDDGGVEDYQQGRRSPAGNALSDHQVESSLD